MAKLSVIIPARNEALLIPTIESVFKNAKGEVEVVAVLEGYYPEGWQETVAKYPNLHTIHHSEAQGMRKSINDGVASAISRGTKYIAKFDAHCCFGEGFDEILKADCDKDWIVVPRRKRLDPDTFAPRTDGRPDIDYHYLSFPDNPQDFGGPGLNGKVWEQRARERFGKPEYDIDDEMSSQGSGWFMHAEYFTRMGFMDAESYGQFWSEFQELGLSCWLSGGQVKVNKKTFYAHWHKGSAGRGYNLPKEWLNKGATFTKRWLFNEASSKQTLPFKFIIERFSPVPSWPENWEELVYGSKVLAHNFDRSGDAGNTTDTAGVSTQSSLLTIHHAYYGIGDPTNWAGWIDVTNHLQSLVQNGSLDVVVTNDSLKVGNPFRGEKKKLRVTYSYDGGEQVTVEREEREWLIIGRSARYVKGAQLATVYMENKVGQLEEIGKFGGTPPMSAPALNDFLIRRFNIPSHRLRGPMPIEVPTFHRNDLAKLFAELGFNKGAEIGVAEGNYSEILCKANPKLELLCVDPWHHYSGNPQGKSPEKDAYALNEAVRKLKGYNVTFIPLLSMEAIYNGEYAIDDGSLDFVYVDAHHGFSYVLQDIIEWSKKVRSGGIIAGDDLLHLDPKRWGAGPIEAVYAYTKAMGISPWFLIDAHKSVDYFWVKQ